MSPKKGKGKRVNKAEKSLSNGSLSSNTIDEIISDKGEQKSEEVSPDTTATLNKKSGNKLEESAVSTTGISEADIKGEENIVTLCLTMIVKNESRIIHRCLNSVKDMIDFVCITDTGSTDNTVELIEEWGKTNNIPCKVCKSQFTRFDFATARSLSFTNSKENFPQATYALLLDGDMLLEVLPNFEKNVLTHSAYNVRQYSAVTDYRNMRLLRLDHDWACVGLTHEYWKCRTPNNQRGNLDTLRIDDREDGGSKSDKYVRDRTLLLDGLQHPEGDEEGLHNRYMFYLAQTYKCLGQYEEAIFWYSKHNEQVVWEEQKWYAAMEIGNCNKELAYITENKHKQKHNKLVEEIKTSRNRMDYLAGLINDETDESKKTQINNQLDQEKQKFIGLELNINSMIKTDNAEGRMIAGGGYFEKAAGCYLTAYGRRPHRAEPLYHLSNMYRILGFQRLSYQMAALGKIIKYPSNDGLFISRLVYDWQLDYEISIVAYYLPDKKELGKLCVKKLLKMKDKIPEREYNTLMSNSKFYGL